ncbi:hypothetical protein [Rhodococcus sp. ABRD24]|nr:hypothetical protein [Rhodococcus sp. ABRD24]
MGSADLAPYLEFVVDFADATSDLFTALGFFAGSLEIVGQLLG